MRVYFLSCAYFHSSVDLSSVISRKLREPEVVRRRVSGQTAGEERMEMNIGPGWNRATFPASLLHPVSLGGKLNIVRRWSIDALQICQRSRRIDRMPRDVTLFAPARIYAGTIIPRNSRPVSRRATIFHYDYEKRDVGGRGGNPRDLKVCPATRCNR